MNTIANTQCFVFVEPIHGVRILSHPIHKKKALAINAVMRSFDTGREVPIYVRSAKIKQLAENQFAAEDIVMTSTVLIVHIG